MKREEFDKTNITPAIQLGLKNSECKNTGTPWVRNCPKCNKELTYTNKRSFEQICETNSPCRSCCQLGNKHPHTDAHRKHMSNLLRGRIVTDEWKNRIKKNHWSTNPILKKSISEAQSKLICGLFKSGKMNGKNKAFKSGYFYNITNGEMEFYRSSYEQIRMEQLNNDSMVKSWTTKHNIKIPYSKDNIIHNYLPDFLIVKVDGQIIIEETKGYIENAELLNLKIIAARKYCKANNFKYKISYDHPAKSKNK